MYSIPGVSNGSGKFSNKSGTGPYVGRLSEGEKALPYPAGAEKLPPEKPPPNPLPEKPPPKEFPAAEYAGSGAAE